MGLLKSGAFLTLMAGACLAAPDRVAAHGDTPALIWRDVASVRVLCLVQADDPTTRAKLEDHICSRVRQIATPGAPAEVSRIALGEPALLRQDTVTLLVHATVQQDRGDRLLALTIRPFRISSEQTSQLFGAAPRIARLPASTPGSKSLDAALAAALSETLPWLQRPQAPRLITR